MRGMLAWNTMIRGMLAWNTITIITINIIIIFIMHA
jgi:hypothetical protein